MVPRYYWHGAEPYVYRWSGSAHPGSKVNAEVSGLGLFPPQDLSDWAVLGVIGYLGYRFLWKPRRTNPRRRSR